MWLDKPDFFQKNQKGVERRGACVLLYRHAVLPYVLPLQQLRLLRQFLPGNRKTEESEVRGQQHIDRWVRERQRQMVVVTLLLFFL